MKISLVMIVKNEEQNLGRCLDSAKNIVDEIVIVDTGSTDNTKKIAEEFNAKIFDFKWTNNFAAARNFGIKKSTGDWNLILDADEFIEPDSREKLISFAKENPDTIGRLRFKHSFMEDNILSYSMDELPRFAPKGILYYGKIHEQIDIKVKRKSIDVCVEHIGYLNTNKADRNLSLILKELKSNPNDSYMLYQAARTYFVAKEYKKADQYFKKCYQKVKNKESYSKTLITSYIYNLSNLPNIELGLKIIEEQIENYKNDVDFNFACGVFYLNLILFNTNKYMEYINLIEDSYIKCLNIGDNGDVVGLGSFKALYNLGSFYDVFGFKDKAIECYKLSSEYGFEPAIERLEKQN